ncbi:hypothetical protein V493_01410 [Pseudogymnoascus sp. VKM F-4281 (FW-2241)]|nr:hypothetical protein V493_01410 [Pseudogymnoascus sp. VKM F-4281 (FW-2241)]
MDRHDHVDGQGEDIPLEPALSGPLIAKTTAEEVTSDQPSFRLLPKKDNENNGAYGGGGKYSGARKGSDKTIELLYTRVMYWGAFRWIVSWVVFGTAVSIVASGAVPVVVPYAAFNLVCACVNIILLGPLLRHTASATNSRPPTLWLARQTLLIVLWIASVAISIAMVVQTYEYAGEKDSMRKICYGTKTGRHRCRSARASIHTSCIIGLIGAALTLQPIKIHGRADKGALRVCHEDTGRELDVFVLEGRLGWG